MFIRLVAFNFGGWSALVGPLENGISAHMDLFWSFFYFMLLVSALFPRWRAVKKSELQSKPKPGRAVQRPDVAQTRRGLELPLRDFIASAFMHPTSPSRIIPVNWEHCECRMNAGLSFFLFSRVAGPLKAYSNPQREAFSALEIKSDGWMEIASRIQTATL